jgi:hypothetical protein
MNKKCLKSGGMKARKPTDSKFNENQPILATSKAKDNICAFFKLLLKIDKRNNPKIYENQESRNYPHTPS